ncbi:hypothetical protein [Persicitalea sp.]|uniref:hypothetical protein n=1 Tax=Persicitalea sp. TaxID=3100273 RepID=UPI0035931AB9
MNYTIYPEPIAKEDEMNPEAKASFEGGYLTVVLPVGYVLWRFISRMNDRRFGAFWVDVPTMTNLMNALHTSGNFSETYKKDNVRDNLAVLTSWSNLSWRLKIRVNKEVIAYVGRTGLQKHFMETENRTAFGGDAKMEKAVEQRIGGFDQYVIPRFRGLPNENNCAQIEHFAHI